MKTIATRDKMYFCIIISPYKIGNYIQCKSSFPCTCCYSLTLHRPFLQSPYPDAVLPTTDLLLAWVSLAFNMDSFIVGKVDQIANVQNSI